jgi:hypothetical protein
LHPILDNHATRTTPTIRWLLRHQRFVFQFVPKGASWLNLVERWPAEITSELLRRRVHMSVADLETDIRSSLVRWNHNPRPYVWVKTPDGILTNLARYCERNSEARH